MPHSSTASVDVVLIVEQPMEKALSRSQKDMVLQWAQRLYNLPATHRGVLKRSGDRIRVEIHNKEFATSSE